MRSTTSLNRIYFVILFCAISLSACFSNNLSSTRGVKNTAGLSNGGLKTTPIGVNTGTPSGTLTHKISQVTIAQVSPTILNIAIDRNYPAAPASPRPLTDFCGSVPTSSACFCRFQWDEINTTTGNPVTIKHSVDAGLSNIQTSLAQCKVPAAYDTQEIIDGTRLTISLQMAPSSAAFNVAPTYFNKSVNPIMGTWQSDDGTSFQDVLRYTCHDTNTRGLDLKNRIGSSNRVLSTQFCASKADGTASPGCSSSVTGVSSEAFYYNLYIRESEVGDVNASNGRFTCPKVREPLRPTALTNQVYPLDSTFALAMQPTGDFPIGVEAFSKINTNTNEPAIQDSFCFSKAQASTDRTGLVRSCLGFAARPQAGGVCPAIKDVSGRLRSTYRLRRYIALYPKLFDANGYPLTSGGNSIGQSTDTIYVLDRPVKNPNPSAQNPEFSMLGPKPCPFAYFDRKGITGQTAPSSGYAKGLLPQYVATNAGALPDCALLGGAHPSVCDSALPFETRLNNFDQLCRAGRITPETLCGWRGKNVDGVQFPNEDSGVNQSCSATLPVYDTSKTTMALTTLNASNVFPEFQRKFIRPITPWAPAYLEDPDFTACAPEPDKPADPPLHFATYQNPSNLSDPQNGNVSYCAEVYPTQNDNVLALDTRPSPTAQALGYVRNFTSHVSKHSAAGSCAATSIGATLSAAQYPPAPGGALPSYPVAGLPPNLQGQAHHPASQWIDADMLLSRNLSAAQTCDRTTLTPQSSWPYFPLLARPETTELALRSMSEYNCAVTYDGFGSRSSGGRSPSGGCCALLAKVKTKSSGSAAPDAGYADSAHLEPLFDAQGINTQRCRLPDY